MFPTQTDETLRDIYNTAGPSMEHVFSETLGDPSYDTLGEEDEGAALEEYDDASSLEEDDDAALEEYDDASLEEDDDAALEEFDEAAFEEAYRADVEAGRALEPGEPQEPQEMLVPTVDLTFRPWTFPRVSLQPVASLQPVVTLELERHPYGYDSVLYTALDEDSVEVDVFAFQ
ncbi:uncharacterized protein LTR77_005042 [Saxophila tyrrhenica]|uniref:Uncharacterized protein n=1 Tax=Saxophila tyrrhenica TaxID=1690608 RepID=A0AAV9PB51_9PEZI|nr:hypothetical protein LTR77_005042 [Saxophila tyrrhenica]